MGWLDGYETDLEIRGGAVVLKGRRDGLASIKFLMSSLATGLIEDAWSSRISKWLCLFGFVIVLIEERGGQPRGLLYIIASGIKV